MQFGLLRWARTWCLGPPFSNCGASSGPTFFILAPFIPFVPPLCCMWWPLPSPPPPPLPLFFLVSGGEQVLGPLTISDSVKPPVACHPPPVVRPMGGIQFALEASTHGMVEGRGKRNVVLFGMFDFPSIF